MKSTDSRILIFLFFAMPIILLPYEEWVSLVSVNSYREGDLIINTFCFAEVAQGTGLEIQIAEV